MNQRTCLTYLHLLLVYALFAHHDLNKPTRKCVFCRHYVTKVCILPTLRHEKCVFSALYGGDITSRKCVFFKKVCILVT